MDLSISDKYLFRGLVINACLCVKVENLLGLGRYRKNV